MLRNKKKRRLTFTMEWQWLEIAVLAAVALGALLTFRLGTLTRGLLSSREAHIHTNYRTLHDILHNPINAPYKLIDYLFLHIDGSSAALARMASVVVALAAIGLFFATILRWHGRRAALLSTLLFAASSWILHVGRLGTSDVMYVLLPLSLLALAAWLNVTERHGVALACMTIVCGLAFYTPGAIWFLIAGYVLIHKAIINHVRHALLWEKICCTLATLLLAGILVSAIVHTPTILRSWLFLPVNFPTPFTIAKQLVESVTFLFVRGPYEPDLWLAHTPVFDVFTSVMCVIGVYFYARHYKNLRTHVIVTFIIIGGVLTALNGVYAFGYIVPLAYLLAATGLTYLLHKWLTIFPRNPVARTLGVGLVSLVVITSAVYHTTSYFVAWRYDPTTVSAFTNRP